MNQTEAKQKILEAVLQLFQKQGLKFTMDDVASSVGMSKKTIYQLFHDKEQLLYNMVDFCFLSIKQSEQDVLQSDLSIPDKIRAILGAMPERYLDIDFRQLYVLKDRYPKIYRHVEERLENDWEPTIQLLQQGMEEGCVRSFNIFIFKLMLESAISQFFQKNVLLEHNLTYTEGLQEVVSILVDGILIKEGASDK